LLIFVFLPSIVEVAHILAIFPGVSGLKVPGTKNSYPFARPNNSFKMGCGSSKKAPDAVHPTGPSPSAPAKAAINQASTLEEVKIKGSNFVGKSDTHLTKNYEIGRVLGDGAFGKVSIGTHRRTKAKRAIKSIQRTKRKSEEDAFLNEVEILAKMDHPHIIKLYEYYIDAKHFHLITDMCSGGELFDYILD
jgi:calcium-dependent protein kinase